jgi:hypothetical protein
MRPIRADILVVALFCLGANLQADVLVRWDQDEIPPQAALGITKVVIPAGNVKAVEHASTQGYEVYLEHATSVAQPSRAAANVRTVDRRGKWPHIRTNWVTRRNDVLQVAGRSAQPWLESNAALIRIVQAADPEATPLLTYAWKPVTVSDADEGPALENYLVAIAEAGSFGADLVLPLHRRFENDLLLGKPRAHAAWKEIRRYIDFYSANLPRHYREIANVGVVTADPMKSFEVMNLLARHNVPFRIIDAARLQAGGLAPFKLVILVGQSSESAVVAEFARKGGAIVTSKPGTDPNTLALDVRRQLGRENRAIDIWNGMTVIAAPYEEPDNTGLLVTVVNYAHQPLPVQMRVRGTFSQVHYESPEQEATLLSYERRDGYTEFVIPALRIGGRLFLN